MQGAPANNAHTTQDPSWLDQLEHHPHKGEPGYLTWRFNFTAVLIVIFLVGRLTVAKLWERKSTEWATRGKP